VLFCRTEELKAAQNPEEVMIVYSLDQLDPVTGLKIPIEKIR